MWRQGKRGETAELARLGMEQRAQLGGEGGAEVGGCGRWKRPRPGSLALSPLRDEDARVSQDSQLYQEGLRPKLGVTGGGGWQSSLTVRTRQPGSPPGLSGQ